MIPVPFQGPGFSEWNLVTCPERLLQQITGLIQLGVVGRRRRRRRWVKGTKIGETFKLHHPSQRVVAKGLDGGGHCSVVWHEMLSPVNVPVERIEMKRLCGEDPDTTPRCYRSVHFGKMFWKDDLIELLAKRKN